MRFPTSKSSLLSKDLSLRSSKLYLYDCFDIVDSYEFNTDNLLLHFKSRFRWENNWCRWCNEVKQWFIFHLVSFLLLVFFITHVSYLLFSSLLFFHYCLFLTFCFLLCYFFITAWYIYILLSTTLHASWPCPFWP